MVRGGWRRLRVSGSGCEGVKWSRLRCATTRILLSRSGVERVGIRWSSVAVRRHILLRRLRKPRPPCLQDPASGSRGSRQVATPAGGSLTSTTAERIGGRCRVGSSSGTASSTVSSSCLLVRLPTATGWTVRRSTTSPTRIVWVHAYGTEILYCCLERCRVSR